MLGLVTPGSCYAIPTLKKQVEGVDMKSTESSHGRQTPTGGAVVGKKCGHCQTMAQAVRESR